MLKSSTIAKPLSLMGILCWLPATIGWPTSIVGAQFSTIQDRESQRVFEIDMVDETRIVGTPDLTTLGLDLGFEKIEIPIELIRAVQLNPNRATKQRFRFIVNLINGDRFSGNVLNTEIRVRFSAGEVVLPFDGIVTLRLVTKGTDLENSNPNSQILRFDFENSKPTLVFNTAQNKLHARHQGVKVRPDEETQNRNNVAILDGRHGLTIAHDAQLCPQKFTLAAWINPTGNRDSYAIIAGKTSPSSWADGYALAYMRNDPKRVHFFVNGYSAIAISAVVPSDRWSHVVGTCDGKVVALYFNGKQVARRSIPRGTKIKHSSSPFRIGSDANAYYWTGKIDDVILSTGAQSAESIQQEFNAN